MPNSKSLTYDYLRFLEKDEKDPKIIREIYAPFIPIRLFYDRKLSPLIYAMVDSGAARNLLPAIYGVYLGIDIRQGKHTKLLGIGGVEVKAFTHRIKIYVGLHFFATEADFSFEQKVPLLGRDGFFDLFQKIIFDENFHQLQLVLKNES